MRSDEVAKALSSKVRLDVLEWLRDPESNFESMVVGDLSDDGVCVSLLAYKAGVSQPTMSRHLSVLRDVGLVETHRVAQHRYHRRNEAGIERAKQMLTESL